MTEFFAGTFGVGALIAMRWILQDPTRQSIVMYRLGVGAAIILAFIFAIAGGELYGVLILAMISIPLLPHLIKTIKETDIEKEFASVLNDRSTPDEMTRPQALAILGLSGNPTPEEIKKAHKALIRKVHPDNGGSDYLSHQVNQARDVLLNS